MPVGKGELVVMTIAGLMVRESTLAAVSWLPSVTLTSNCEVPVPVGWPLITPVAEFNVRPPGRVPATIAQVYVPMPPVAVKACE